LRCQTAGDQAHVAFDVCELEVVLAFLGHQDRPGAVEQFTGCPQLTLFDQRLCEVDRPQGQVGAVIIPAQAGLDVESLLEVGDGGGEVLELDQDQAQLVFERGDLAVGAAEHGCGDPQGLLVMGAGHVQVFGPLPDAGQLSVGRQQGGPGRVEILLEHGNRVLVEGLGVVERAHAVAVIAELEPEHPAQLPEIEESGGGSCREHVVDVGRCGRRVFRVVAGVEQADQGVRQLSEKIADFVLDGFAVVTQRLDQQRDGRVDAQPRDVLVEQTQAPQLFGGQPDLVGVGAEDALQEFHRDGFERGAEAESAQQVPGFYVPDQVPVQDQGRRQEGGGVLRVLADQFVDAGVPDHEALAADVPDVAVEGPLPGAVEIAGGQDEAER
jgi:hypothetical protein